jgi:hypothetical protein
MFYVYRLHARLYWIVLFPGVTLSQEGDGVWVYNRSDSPIFINSPTLEDPESRTLLVYRVPPGHCLNIFNADKASCARHWDYAGMGPVDPNSVRISFAKGWGPNYSRQEVTACPCWLEVLLAPCRWWDAIDYAPLGLPSVLAVNFCGRVLQVDPSELMRNQHMSKVFGSFVSWCS